MTAPNRNAAIFYAQDGFDPKAKGINGRRVAGDSFLRGFLRHADVDEVVLMSKEVAEIEPVKVLAQELRPGLATRHVPMRAPNALAPVGTFFYPSPNYTTDAWRRAPYGTGSWSICGITHTTSTTAVMRGFFDLRFAPVMDWDAVICTSRAVQSAVQVQFDLTDQHVRAHFGANPPPRPMFARHPPWRALRRFPPRGRSRHFSARTARRHPSGCRLHHHRPSDAA